MTEFPNKILTRSGLDYLPKKIDAHAAVKRLSGSGRPRGECAADGVDVVEELVMNQENQSQTRRTILSINFNSIAPF